MDLDAVSNYSNKEIKVKEQYDTISDSNDKGGRRLHLWTTEDFSILD